MTTWQSEITPEGARAGADRNLMLLSFPMLKMENVWGLCGLN
jgi:hypothetical protein